MLKVCVFFFFFFYEKPSKDLTVFSPKTVHIKILAKLTANTKHYGQITQNTIPLSTLLFVRLSVRTLSRHMRWWICQIFCWRVYRISFSIDALVRLFLVGFVVFFSFFHLTDSVFIFLLHCQVVFNLLILILPKYQVKPIMKAHRYAFSTDYSVTSI